MPDGSAKVSAICCRIVTVSAASFAKASPAWRGSGAARSAAGAFVVLTFYISIYWACVLAGTGRSDTFPGMTSAPISRPRSTAPGWEIAPETGVLSHFSTQNHAIVTVDNLLHTPEHAISQAILQNFARITPQYPGLRAPLGPEVSAAWLGVLAPQLDRWFGAPGTRWEMQGWYSIVTTAPRDLAPIQRLPHVDGTDPRDIAMMLYLHRTGHGGTAFFRHLSTGLEALTADDYPRYAAALQADVARTGLPPAAYATDGAPHFARTHVVPGHFNSAVFYRGNILHSGVIDNAAPLVPDPRAGRLTINAFFRPADEGQQGRTTAR